MRFASRHEEYLRKSIPPRRLPCRNFNFTASVINYIVELTQPIKVQGSFMGKETTTARYLIMDGKAPLDQSTLAVNLE